MNFYSKKTGQLVATDYNQVVIGGQGPYIEFSKSHLVELETTPGQEYRGKGKYSSCKYFWLQPKGDNSVKVYHQRGVVDYADYKIGDYYISPDELTWNGSDLRARKGTRFTTVPTIYSQKE